MVKFSERLATVIKKLNYSTNGFEKACGVSSGTFAKAIANGKDVNTATLLTIAEAFPQININWLVAGRGEPLENSPNPETHNGKTLPAYDLETIKRKLRQTEETIERMNDFLVETAKAGEDHEKRLQKLEAGRA